ncbi:MAG: hypothetical protein BWY42_01367 [Candidatus Omnitrophica bacterium ADurb.Bin277]|nr:MAG: hypothetical protein BWY42_01367 [Candidatus Omnitrophica bacterium ADurb.Bin277]
MFERTGIRKTLTTGSVQIIIGRGIGFDSSLKKRNI